MIELTLGVDYQDGTRHEVVIGPATQVAFEDKFGVSFMEISDGKPRMGWLYWLVWDAMTRTGRCAVTYDEWLNLVGALSTEKAEDPGPLGVVR